MATKTKGPAVSKTEEPAQTVTKTRAPAGSFTLADLAREMGIDPKMARRRFRAMAKKGTVEHNHRDAWIFSDARRDEIRKALTK